MGKALSRLEEKKRNLGMRKLGQFGIDVDRWLAMLNASDAEMQCLAAAWPQFRSSFIYDAVSILGLGPASAEPLPDPAPGEIVIRVGDWSLQDLRSNETVVRKNLMHDQDWYHRFAWSREKMKPGIHRVRIPVPDSNRKNAAEQEASFPKGEEFAPVTLVATAMLVHRLQTGESLLGNDWTRCKERADADRRVVLNWNNGRLYVYFSYWGADRGDCLWASSVRTSES